MAAVEVTTGDLLELDVEVIVNAWNRNIIPWWLLLLTSSNSCWSNLRKRSTLNKSLWSDTKSSSAKSSTTFAEIDRAALLMSARPASGRGAGGGLTHRR